MAAVVKELEISGERFIELGGKLLVASKSNEGDWYEISGETCTCLGFQYRGKCRHVVAAAQLPTPEREPVVEVEWSVQFGGWLVRWAGFVHGGVHFNRADADLHAAELAADPGVDEWIAMHGGEAW
jgi:hypothetical protein